VQLYPDYSLLLDKPGAFKAHLQILGSKESIAAAAAAAVIAPQHHTTCTSSRTLH
jgi:hypothetical protein